MWWQLWQFLQPNNWELAVSWRQEECRSFNLFPKEPRAIVHAWSARGQSGVKLDIFATGCLVHSVLIDYIIKVLLEHEHFSLGTSRLPHLYLRKWKDKPLLSVWRMRDQAQLSIIIGHKTSLCMFLFYFGLIILHRQRSYLRRSSRKVKPCKSVWVEFFCT